MQAENKKKLRHLRKTLAKVFMSHRSCCLSSFTFDFSCSPPPPFICWNSRICQCPNRAITVLANGLSIKRVFLKCPCSCFWFLFYDQASIPVRAAHCNYEKENERKRARLMENGNCLAIRNELKLKNSNGKWPES